MGWKEEEDGGYSWSDDGGDGGGDDGEEQRREEERDREREEERDREREQEREREKQQERERERQREREEEARRRAEEEERQRQIEEQRRQVEEEQRRMAEEEARRQAEEAQRQQEEADAQAALARNQESIDQGTSQGLATDEPSAMDQWLRDREADEQARRDAEREYTPNVEGDRYHYGQDPMAVAEAPPTPTVIEPVATPDPVDLEKPKEEDIVAEATRAAEDVYRSGGSATQAQAAAGAAAAKTASIDRQSLSTQTPWTQQAFRTQYGQSADTEWVRQHEAELRRNQQTYGSPEPKAGTRPIASAPANTPVAPDRRIGQTPPPAARPATPAAPAQNILGLGAIGDQPAPGAAPPPQQGLERDTDMLTIRDATPGGTDAAQIQRSNWNAWPEETKSRWEVTNAVGASPAPTVQPAAGHAARPSTALPGIQPLPPRNETDGIRTGPPTAGEPGGPPLASPPPPVRDDYRTPPARPVDVGTPPVVGPIANAPDDDDVLELTAFTPDGERVTSQIDRRTFESAPAEVRQQYETRVITPGAVVRGGTPAPAAPAAPAPAAPQAQQAPSTPPPPELRDPVYARSYNGMTEGWFNRSEVGSAHTLIYDPKQGQTKLSVVDPNTPTVRPHPASQQVRIDSQGNVIDDSRLITPRNEGPLDPNTGAPIVRMGSTETTAPPTAAGADDMSVRVVQALDSPTPLTSISELAALVQGKSQEEARGDYVHVINGVGALLRGEKEGVWAEPYLNDVARLAWARERLRDSGERVDPRLAPTDYIENWKDALLGNDPNVPMVREVNQQLIDAAVDRNPGKFDWRTVYGPTGENGLISKQTTGIDCGPNAFSNVLRANGYNSDPSQAFNFAIDKGFHTARRLPNGQYTDGEFTGPDNFARMLSEQAGLDAKAEAISWSKIDQELAEGRIVTLSGRTHYWTIAAKQDGKYYVGQTGTVAGNPAWSTPGQLFYSGSGPNTMITYKGQVDPNSNAVKTLGLKPPVGGGTTNRALLSSSTNSTQQNAAGPAARVQAGMEADAQRRPASPDLPAHLQQGRPQTGLRAGASEPADQTATLWQRAYEQTNDREFADGVTALIMSEGGMRGGIGDQGQSAGIFQMYWGGGEGNNFEKWLRDQKGFKGSQREAMNLAKDNDLAMEFYLPKLKKYYDSGKQQGFLIPTQAIAVGGHNSRAPKDPQVWQAYADAWEDYKRGETEATKNTVVKLSSNTPAPAPVASTAPKSDFDPFQGVRQRRGGDNRVALMSTSSDFQSFDPNPETSSPDLPSEMAYQEQQAQPSAVTESIETLRRDAQNEDPWSKDPAGQVNRHKGMRLYHEMPLQERERIFDESMDEALTAEGIMDPNEREYWKDNAKKVVKGAGFPGENPNMNPFAMAGENKGTPLYAAPASDKSAASNELNSSAIGYYQFIMHDPDDRNKDPYGHRQFVPNGGNIYDPVTQQRMFIRAVRGGKHEGDPASVVREKRDSPKHTWGP